MSGKIIIIGGHLASGKSTFARQLSAALCIPYFVKDTFKIALCANIPINNKEESSRFSTVTFDGMLYVTERHMEVSAPLIIEGNFAPPGVKGMDEAGSIKALLNRYDCAALTYMFTGDTHILHERYIKRDKLPERGDVNRFHSNISYDVFRMYCQNLDAFDVGGEIIRVDTTDFAGVDFTELINRARLFMQESEGKIAERTFEPL